MAYITMRTSNNLYNVSLSKIGRDMAKKNSPINNQPFSIGDFHIGYLGSKYFVWSKNFYRDLKQLEFFGKKYFNNSM